MGDAWAEAHKGFADTIDQLQKTIIETCKPQDESELDQLTRLVMMRANNPAEFAKLQEKVEGETDRAKKRQADRLLRAHRNIRDKMPNTAERRRLLAALEKMLKRYQVEP